MPDSLKLSLAFSTVGSPRTIGEILAIQKALRSASIETAALTDSTKKLIAELKGLEAQQGRSQGRSPTRSSGGARDSGSGKTDGGTSKTFGSAPSTSGSSSESSDPVKVQPKSLEQLGQIAFHLNNIVGLYQNIAAAAGPAYDLLIGANERLNAQLLSSQANLASSTRLFQGGVEITDPTEKIKASQSALKAALKQIEVDTQSLVGVTSSQVNELFQITLTNAGELNNQSKQFADPIAAATSLTKGWAASLKVVGIPLSAARQEINSILKGQIDNNSALATNLKINNNMVSEWKAQGTLVDELNKRLEVFVAGNGLAARSIEGIGSNIKDLFERIGRNAGEPLLEPIINELADMESYLKRNEGNITNFFSSLTEAGAEFIENNGEILEPLFEGLDAFAKEAGPVVTDLFGLILQGYTNLSAAIANDPLLGTLGKIIVKATEGIGYLTELLSLNQINDAAEAISILGKQSANYANEANTLVPTLQRLNEAQKDGKRLTAEQAEEQKKARAQATTLVQGIDRQIAALKSVNAVGEENRRQRDLEIAQQEQLKQAILNADGGLKIQAASVAELGTTYEQLDKKAQNALTQVNSDGGGDAAQLQESAKVLTDITQQQLELGAISSEEAKKRLSDLANNKKLEVGIQQEAQQALLKISQDEIDAEIDVIKSGEADIAAAREEGAIGAAEAEKQLTAVKLAEIGKRIEAIQLEKEAAKGETAKKKLGAEEKNLLAEQRKIQSAENRRADQEELKDYDEKLSELQARRDDSLVGEADFNKQKLALGLARNTAEIEQQKIALNKLGADDTEGREAINAKIAELTSKKSAIVKEGRDQERKLLVEDFDEQTTLLETQYAKREISEADFQKRKAQLGIGKVDEQIRQAKEDLEKLAEGDKEGRERILAQIAKFEGEKIKIGQNAAQEEFARLEKEQAKALAAVEESQSERLIALKRLQRDGLRQDGEVAIERDRIQAESIKRRLSLLQEQEAFLAQQSQNSELGPEAIEQIEEKKRGVRAKTLQLTEQLIDQEIAANERLRAEVIEKITAQLNAKVQAIDLEISSLTNLTAARSRETARADLASQRETAALDAASKAMDRQNTLLTAKRRLQVANANALEANTEIRLQQIQFAIDKGIGNELELTREKQALEARAAAQKRQALLDEQAQARKQVELDNRRADLADRRALIEARIGELKAKQGVLDAEAALRETQLASRKELAQAQSALEQAQQQQPGRERDQAVAQAKVQLRLTKDSGKRNEAAAQEGVEAATQQADFATENTKIVQLESEERKKVVELADQALKLEQETALKRFDAAEAIRQQTAALEGAARAQNALADGAERERSARGGGGQTITPRLRGGDVQPGQTYAMAEDGRPESVRFPGFPEPVLITQPGLYEVDRPGWVNNAAETARLLQQGAAGLRSAIPASVMTEGAVSLPSSDLDAAVLQELRSLRRVVASRDLSINAPITVASPDASDAHFRAMRSFARSVL